MIKMVETANPIPIKLKITRDWLTENYMYDDVYRGFRLMQGKYEIKIDKATPRVQHRPRRTPVMMKNNVIQKIIELEDTM